VLPQAAPSKGSLIDAWINSLCDAPPLNYSATLLQRQSGLSAFQRLYLAPFIKRQGDGVGGRIDRPSNPSSIKRPCQRQTHVLDLPV